MAETSLRRLSNNNKTTCAFSPKNGLLRAFARLVFGLVLVGSAQAQDPAAEALGGTLRNEAERSMTRPALPDVAPKTAPETPANAPLKGDTVVVQRFEFTGNIVLTDAVLNRAVAGYIGRPIDFSDLQNAASMAALAYRERGYVATVSIPRQEIADGVITLKVSEARYSGATLDASSTGRIRSELILARVERAMQVEKAVNTNILDRQVLLLNDLPGASVRAGLAPGDEEGDTRVVLQSDAKPLVTGNLIADVNGAVSTGRERTTIDLAFNSPDGKGEQYTVSAMGSSGIRYGRVGASFPVGLDGARLGVNASTLDYRVIDGPSVLSDLHGSSTSAGVDLSYPLVRSQQANLYLTGGLVTKRFDNYAGVLRTRLYETHAGTASATGNWFDRLFGGASNQASVQLTLGQLVFQDETSRLSDALTARTQGWFDKLLASLSRNQSLPGGWSLVLSYSGQRSTKNLDSSERFFLGGPTGLRAFPVSEGGGSEGDLLQAELRKKLGNGFELRLFRDHGRVKQSVVGFLGNPTPNELRYDGAGAGVVWQGPKGFTLSVTWSRRLSENPFPAMNPGRTDQDGTLVRERVWASASLPF